MEQYKDFLPKQLFIPTSVFPQHEGLYKLEPSVEAEQQKFYSALAAANIKPDYPAASAWDPANIIVGALRKLGTKANAEQVRDYIASQTDLPGISGLYNFKKVPQRGLTVANAVVTRWDAVRAELDTGEPAVWRTSAEVTRRGSGLSVFCGSSSQPCCTTGLACGGVGFSPDYHGPDMSGSCWASIFAPDNAMLPFVVAPAERARSALGRPPALGMILGGPHPLD